MAAPFVTEATVVAASEGAVAEGDPRIGPIIERVSEAIRTRCGWIVAPTTTETLELDGYGGDTIHVPSLHIVEVEELQFDGLTVPPADYRVSKRGMIRMKRGEVPDEFDSIRIRLTHGFESAPDVAQVCLQLCLNGLSSPMGATREQAGQIMIDWGSRGGGVRVTPDEHALLAPYRLPNLAGGSY